MLKNLIKFKRSIPKWLQRLPGPWDSWRTKDHLFFFGGTFWVLSVLFFGFSFFRFILLGDEITVDPCRPFFFQVFFRDLCTDLRIHWFLRLFCNIWSATKSIWSRGYEFGFFPWLQCDMEESRKILQSARQGKFLRFQPYSRLLTCLCLNFWNDINPNKSKLEAPSYVF